MEVANVNQMKDKKTNSSMLLLSPFGNLHGKLSEFALKARIFASI